MNVLIDNTGFKNKGAELMLLSAMQGFKEFIDDSSLFAIHGKPSYHIKGLYSITNQTRQNGVPLKQIPSLIKKNVFGLFDIDNIDLVLDVGGFRYSDKFDDIFDDKKIRSLKKYYQDLKSNGVKVILMPQAFGGFSTEKSKSLMIEIYPFFDLIFARDEESYKHLSTVVGKRDNILMYPDFTAIYNVDVDRSFRKKYNHLEEAICIIPNYKMINYGSDFEANNYIEFMRKVTKLIVGQGYKVFLLNHEGDEDERVIKSIAQFSDLNIEVVTKVNAKEAKWLIGRSKLCVSSRYHGVVNALSQGTPCFCTSWSHKYITLMKEYGFVDGVLNISENDNSIHKVLNLLGDSSLFNSTKMKIEKGHVRTKEKVVDMWLAISENIKAS